MHGERRAVLTDKAADAGRAVRDLRAERDRFMLALSEIANPASDIWAGAGGAVIAYAGRVLEGGAA